MGFAYTELCREEASGNNELALLMWCGLSL
jgi:hypothetical protein